MDGFIALLTKLVIKAGVDRSCIHHESSLELPGFFRPNKKWDFVVVVAGKLIAALEAKSQVGPSFGNNFNNRTEEAMGTALDLWTAYREKAFGLAVRPWIGYLFLLEDCPRSTTPVSVKEPTSKSFPSFAIPPTPGATNFSASGSCSKGITTARRSSCRIPRRVSRVPIPSRTPILLSPLLRVLLSPTLRASCANTNSHEIHRRGLSRD